jgi:hypothetical protein
MAGVLVDLHEAVGEVIGTKGPSRILCGSLNVRAYQQLAAVRWAVEIINNNSWANEFALGKKGLKIKLQDFKFTFPAFRCGRP